MKKLGLLAAVVLLWLVWHGQTLFPLAEWFLTPDGDTALHLAAFAGKLEIVRTLVEGGADVNVKDAAGKTALQVVSEQKPRPPRPTAGALVDGEMPAQPAEVAELLKIADRTVTTHVQHIYKKLEVSSRSEAIGE